MRLWASLRFGDRVWELQLDPSLCPRMAKESPFRNDFDERGLLVLPLVESGRSSVVGDGRGAAAGAYSPLRRRGRPGAEGDDVPMPFAMDAGWFHEHARSLVGDGIGSGVRRGNRTRIRGGGSGVGNDAIFFQGACPNLPTMRRQDDLPTASGGCLSPSSRQSWHSTHGL